MVVSLCKCTSKIGLQVTTQMHNDIHISWYYSLEGGSAMSKKKLEGGPAILQSYGFF